MAKLTEHEQARLDVVIGVTGDDESRVREGIIKALSDVNERGTRNYLWHLLETKARWKIRRARKNARRTI